jgi:16S rRNA (cytidine1402-2'-O)-methyltransferase
VKSEREKTISKKRNEESNLTPDSSRLSPHGALFIVATPIGNLEDVTFRAVRTLREADLIAAEDTRHSRKLLTHYGISRPLTSYFDHNKEFKGNYLLGRLREGLNVALISDAGTPCISDPGFQLVRDAQAGGIEVVPIPGPCAAIAALSAAGLPTDRFAYEGFLPSRQGKRREKLIRVKDEERVTVFYETSNRLRATLGDIMELLGEREVVIARELTKIHEEFLKGSAARVMDELKERKIKGEVVLLVAPATGMDRSHGHSVSDLLKRHIGSEGLSLKDAVKLAALETGLPRSEVYAEALRIKGGK